MELDERDSRLDHAPLNLLAPWIVWTVLAGAATVGYFLIPSSWQSGWYAGLGLAAAAAIVVGILLNRPQRQTAWWFLAIGIFLFGLGDAIWWVLELQHGDDVPYPSVADASYLIAYLPLVVALLVITRHRLPGRDLASLLDATIIATGAGLVVWVFLIDPVAGDGTQSVGARMVSVGYPALDMVLLALAVRLAFTSGRRRSMSSYALVSALLVTGVADIAYGILELQDTYIGGAWVDGAYLIAYVAWGVIALHPSMCRIEEPMPDTVRRAVPARRVVLLGLASLTAPGVLAVQALRGAELHLVEVITGSVLLFLLVVVRLAGLLRTLSSVAMHDTLTGLPNRGVLLERLREQLRQTQPGELAVLFIDLDRFKDVNDSLGHPAGDRLLAEVAGRLSLAVRRRDTVARFGGDEFVILAQVRDRAEAVFMAERVIESLTHPVWIESAPIFPVASVGVAVAAGPADDPDVLLADADTAMFRAKARGKACYELFDETMRGGALERLALEAELRRAIDEDELLVHYQPVLALPEGHVVGFEALVRWYHPDGTVRLPGEFLPVAEETGLIVPIGERVLELALAQLRTWLDTDEGGAELRIAVNLSGRQLAQLDLVESIRAALSRYRIEPHLLYLEVTEQQGLDDQAIQRLAELKALGVRIAIDDFGTGYSSLERLRRFHFDVLKIDRSYIAAINDPHDGAIVQAILAMAAALDVQVVAEGVETPMQLRALVELGCPLAQGILLGAPARPAERPHLAPSVVTPEAWDAAMRERVGS